ncbi:MAG: MerR family DNA-binding protein [Phreatobacter sp.]|uniref:MerR family DNA-binding protein n=1 Tax=Phreatobacter sp. TaxID=1966341 RepID=UPI002733C017|nr:MerR family DNA-binding protein [Phreatobacter sp.]MDP2800904.1 MerR family DNA-binding protein [Phreatobacter sp.]
MNIGQASAASGVSAKMIRYYESIALLPAAGRRDSGYRDYGTEDVHRLSFVRRARDLGFSIPQIRSLLALWTDTDRSNDDVRAIAREHLAEMEDQARKLQEMITILTALVGSCEKGRRSACPIIEELGDHKPAPVARARATRRAA